MRHEVNEKVLNLVRRAVVYEPELGTGDLYERASAQYPEVRRLDRRQFHGRYLLRAKRELRRGERIESRTRPRRYTPDPAGALPDPRPSVLPDNGIPRPAASLPRPEGPPVPDRDRMRRALFAFATEVVGARDDAELVEVIRHLDGHIDDALGSRSSEAEEERAERRRALEEMARVSHEAGEGS